ncbi:putative nudC domain-containing protein 3-like [Apostichopus japonicus]|uniref:Putative nudC domain-containing protein 3-like n=1 Tax=Stichopus japonicus TaxID=307972 RepID=A0A2G8KHF5_STIJA|nr:putative nudC domain-containing protein 3-like [Apostichopus japonicus]
MAAPMANERKLFDANLGDILQDVKRVDAFLDVIFEFLYRRTDFYRIMEHENDVMGLPPGVARKLVMQAYMKYDSVANGPPKIPIDSNDVEANQGQTPDVGKVVEVTTELEESKEEGNLKHSHKVALQEEQKQEESVEDGNKSTIETATDQKTRVLTAADTYNGAERKDYCWAQTLTDVDLKVFVPSNLKKGKDLDVVIKNKSIKVSSKQGDNTVLLDGPLVHDVHSEECMWSLHPGLYVQLTLEKKVQTWWKSVFDGEEEIDQKGIDTTVNIHEMDADSQADYSRVMFDMEQKRQGKPTSKEMETHNMLKQAWNAEGSPFAGSEFDPSIVNVST